jgi:hypothetical protein
MTGVSGTATVEPTLNAAPPRIMPSPAPPWLWLWLVFFVLNLPTRAADSMNKVDHNFGEIARLWGILQPDLNFLFTLRGAHLIIGSFNVFLLNVLDVLPLVILTIGACLLLMPRLRGRQAERTLNLVDLPPDYPSEAFDFYRKFVAQHAAGVAFRAAPTNAGLLAVVYPLSYRRMALGVGSRWFRLWRNDNQAAEAVLVHEIVHVRQGEGWISGFGSPLLNVVRLWPIFMISLLAMELTTGPSITVIPLLILNVTSWTLVNFWLPVAAIWCSELNADRVAANYLPNRLNAALGFNHEEGSLFQRLLNRMSHPPRWLRRLFIRTAMRPLSLVLLLLAFPAMDAFRLLPLLVWGISGQMAQVALGPSISLNLTDIKQWVTWFFSYQMPLHFALIGGAICVWPALSMVFAWVRAERLPVYTQSEWAAYSISSFVVLAVSLAGWLVRLA